jgi:hypothetical protein
LALAQVYVVSPEGVGAVSSEQKKRLDALAIEVGRREQVTLEEIERSRAASKVKEAELEATRTTLAKFEKEVRAPLLEKYGDKPKVSRYADIQKTEMAGKLWAEQTKYSDWYRLKWAVEAAEANLKSARVVDEEFVQRLQEEHRRYMDSAKRRAKTLMAPPEGLLPGTRADADGRFTVEAGSEDWIYVRAARTMPAEQYDWFMPVSKMTLDGGVVLFSNHNLFRDDPPK